MRLRRHFALFLLVPIVAFVTVFGAVSFVSVYFVTKQIVDDQAETGLRFRAETVRLVAEAGLDELRKSGRAGNAAAVDQQKAAAIAFLDRLAQTGLLRIAVLDKEKERLYGLGQLVAIPPASAIVNDDQVHVFDVENRGYYAYSFPFADWQWQVSIVKDGQEYETLKDSLTHVASLSAGVLTLAIALFLVYLVAIMRGPIRSIIGDLAAARPPQYAGIYEFEYLSRSIAEMMRVVREKSDALEHYSNRLEHLVGERTAELTRANEELRQANIDIRNAQQQMLQSEKLASIGQLAAGVAHEINNPLGFVKSNLAALERYLGQLLVLIEAYERHEDLLAGCGEAQRDIGSAKKTAELEFLREDLPVLLGESKDGIARVKKIVEDLREFAHIEKSDWRLFNVNDCLETTLNVLAGELQGKAAIVKDYHPLPEIECLPADLNQVLMNVLMNAGQAIDTNGTITLRTTVRDDGVEIEIGDDGCGIAPENLERIFDPFFTTKPVGTGSGLGLSLSYGIVKKHHGRIEVASTPGKGTTFRILLPLRQPNRELAAKAGPSP